MPFMYCWKCKVCNHRFISEHREGEGCALDHDFEWCVRDYKAERASTHIPMHMSARNTSNKSDFLPSAKDFESPTDPTGEKGMQTWKDTHKPVNSTWV